jgi:uncharacterized protein with HEPN domain
VRRDAAVFLDDIVGACDKIFRYTWGFTAEQFRRDDKTIDAVVRNLEIIGEAAKTFLTRRARRSRSIGKEWPASATF